MSLDPSAWLVERHLREGRGERTALRLAGRPVSYAELAELIDAAALGLANVGVGPGERVVLALLDGVELVAAFLGGLRAGAVPVLVNPLLSGADLAAIVADAGAIAVVLSRERSSELVPLTEGAPDLTTVVVTGDDGALPNRAGTRVLTWSALLASPASVRPADDAMASAGYWLCTSGTTGRPKLAMHRPEDLRVAWETFGRQVLGVGPEDVLYSVAPMFHAYGLGNSLIFPLAAGAAAVLEPMRPPTPARIAAVLADERPTLFFSVPTNYGALVAAELSAADFASVRLAASAGEALPAALFAQARQRLGVEIIDALGSTEMGHVFLSNRPGSARPGTSGTPVPGFDVRLLDDDGVELGPGVPGNLFVRGASAARGYWNRPERTAAVFVGGWVRTGDTYERTHDGDYRYLGRTDELFKVSGEWVSPYEVEAVLLEHPGVEGVAVVSGQTAAGVLQPVAFVVLAAGARPDPGALSEHCRARLTGYKRPREWRFLDELPKTAAGKIRRNVLRELLESEDRDVR